MEYTSIMLLAGVLIISFLTAFLPLIMRILNARFFKTSYREANKWLPIMAGLLFFVAWFIPDIHISNETTTFQQHFVGGGMYSTLLFFYFKQVFDWKITGPSELLYLFGWVSSLGVANELLEFTLTKFGLAHISTSDTDWDLLANTLGAFFCYFIYVAYVAVRKSSKLVH
jgi:hypothetical protein